MIIDRIYHWAHQTPQRTALVWNDQAVSYARFARGIEGVRRVFRAHDLPVGSTAVVAIHSLLDCWTVVLALRSLGLNTVAVLNLDSAVALDLKGVSCVVTDPMKSEHGQPVAQSWPGAAHIKVPNAIYRKVTDGPPPTLDSTGPLPGNHLIYTSGTTGRYKLLMQLAHNELVRMEERAQAYGMREDEPWFVGNLCLWTAVGYRMPLAVWCLGGHVVFDQREKWAECFLRRPCGAMMVPDMVAALLVPSGQSNAPGDWPLWVTAGFISAGQALAVRRQLTTHLQVLYGSSELKGSALHGTVQDVDQMHWLSVAPGRTIEIVDEQGQPCGVGVEGQLRVRLLEQDAKAYLNDTTASDLVFKGDYFYPGDMAVEREDGRIRVLGRHADVLNVKGKKMAVAPIEQAIQDLLGVKAVCIFNGIDEEGLEEVWVVCEGEQQPPAAKLTELRRQLQVFDHVRWLMHPVFPRTTTGTSKVNRRALRQQIFQSPKADQHP